MIKGNILVDDAKTIVDFWNRFGTGKNFDKDIVTIEWDENGRYTFRLRSRAGNQCGYGELLESGGSITNEYLPMNGYVFMPLIRGVSFELVGAFFAALGDRAGGPSDLIPGTVLHNVARGRNIGEVWMKIEELFPQATREYRNIHTLVFHIDPLQPKYWNRVKHLIPISERFPSTISDTHDSRGNSAFHIHYSEVVALTRGAYIWTTGGEE